MLTRNGSIRNTTCTEGASWSRPQYFKTDYADARLYLRSEEGPLVLIEPSKERFIERGRFEQPDRTNVPAWAHPIVANGKLYIRDQDLLLCYEVATFK
ncbi:MAG: hypothetical protein ABL921_00175 [Pirellula sp.]